MPMGKGTYGSKSRKTKEKNPGQAAFQKVASKAKKKAEVKKSAASKSRYDKIIYGNTKRKKK